MSYEHENEAWDLDLARWVTKRPGETDSDAILRERAFDQIDAERAENGERPINRRQWPPVGAGTVSTDAERPANPWTRGMLIVGAILAAIGALLSYATDPDSRPFGWVFCGLGALLLVGGVVSLAVRWSIENVRPKR